MLQSTSLYLISAMQGVSHAHVGGSVKLGNGLGEENTTLGPLVEGSTCSLLSPLLNELLPANKSVAADGFAREEN